MASEKLKPCPVPWCKSTNLTVWVHGVECNSCGCNGPDPGTETQFGAKAEAIAAWNNRPAGTAGEEA